MTSHNSISRSGSLAGRIVTRVIAFVCFLDLPVVITLVVPFSTLVFDKTSSGTTVTVHRYVLIFVPWRTQQIENVTRLRADITAEKTYRGTTDERRKGKTGTSYATGRVAILGDGHEVMVEAAPDLVRAIVARFDQFVADRSAAPVSISVHASWWLSYVLGGVVTALCGLYVTGVVLAILTFPFKFMRARRRPGR